MLVSVADECECCGDDVAYWTITGVPLCEQCADGECVMCGPNNDKIIQGEVIG